jgi:hypothetical protein
MTLRLEIGSTMSLFPLLISSCQMTAWTERLPIVPPCEALRLSIADGAFTRVLSDVTLREARVPFYAVMVDLRMP